MLLLSDFYVFYGFCVCFACVSSYLFDSDFKILALGWPGVDLVLGGFCLSLYAGGSPAATHFLLLRQKKVSKEKATRLSGSLRFAAGNLCWSKKAGVEHELACGSDNRSP